MNREPIYAALFTLLQSTPGIVVSDRTLRHWDDVSPTEMPALFQTQGVQIPENRTREPTRWYVEAKIYVYVSTEGAASPGAVLNPIVDAIEAVLSNFPTVQTLGGLVQWARIEGTCETSEGTLGTKEVIIIPIRMLAV